MRVTDDTRVRSTCGASRNSSRFQVEVPPPALYVHRTFVRLRGPGDQNPRYICCPWDC